MRRLSLIALLVVPFLLADTGTATANPSNYAHFGCAGIAFRIFPHIHHHGPLYNYGPYHGYYPFQPYGPWDAYLRYDPMFYGDPSAYGRGHRGHGGSGGGLGWNPNLFSRHGGGCSSHGFFHASWLHGGWFRGHKWLDGGHGCGHSAGCTSCGGVAVAPAVSPTRDPALRYSGVGNPAQSAAFYSATPTLDPVLELVSTAGRTK